MHSDTTTITINPIHNSTDAVKFNKHQFRGFVGDDRRGDWASFVSHDRQTAFVVNLRTGALVNTFTGDRAWFDALAVVVDNDNADRGWDPVASSFQKV